MDISQSDYTKHYIVEALFKLMKTKDFNSVSITDIAKKAGIGRASFYRAFKSKEDIIVYYFNRGVRTFLSREHFKARGEEDYLETITDVLNMLKEHKEFFKIIIKSHLEHIYLDYLNDNFQDNFRNSLVPQNDYLPLAYSGALYNISIEWVKSDCSASVETIAAALFMAIFSPDTYEKIVNK